MFGKLFSHAIEVRVNHIRELESAPQDIHDESRVAILFSGGLDCTLLARMTSDLLPTSEPIDLLNVAFENPRVHKDASSPFELCPDRITARASFRELQHVCSKREFRLICINIPYTESQAQKQSVIDLMHPHNTEMDLSIAYALYFASRGTGFVALDPMQPESSVPYTTPAKVLLSGLGADELFGGYHRHALSFARTGYAGLLDEMELDINRLGKRNLGRDDRIISHWGKEVRFPYLDEDVVAWALQAPGWEKVGFGVPFTEHGTRDGTSDIEDGKLLLRLLAWKLGMTNVAKEKKRAVRN